MNKQLVVTQGEVWFSQMTSQSASVWIGLTLGYCWHFFTLGCSQSSVGVKHNSESSTHGTRREILGELGLDETRVSVVSNYLAPRCFEMGTSLFVLSSVNVCNALSMIESRWFAFVNVLNFEDCLIFLLSALSTFEVQKDCLLVESIQKLISSGFLT